MTIERPIYINKLLNYKDKDIIKIITGIRRSGKSVLLNELYYTCLKKLGVKEENIIKISFDIEANSQFCNKTALYKYIKSLIKNKQKYYIFLDEIQLVDNFENVINNLQNEFNVDIYVTGSNSKLLSKDINTIFRGRGIEIKVFPFSFKEFLSYKNIDKYDALDQYIKYGGLPYVVTDDNENNKKEYLKMICDTVITKDIIDRYHIRNVDLFTSIIDFLCSSIGSYISTTKIANTLKSNGFKTVDNETIGNYISYLCDSFLFYKVYRYDVKGKEYLKTQNKYYISDLGIRNSKINYRQIDTSHLIENLVYFDLLRKGLTVDIGKNYEKEIDFVTTDIDGRKTYIQVCKSLDEDDTKKREFASFFNLNDGYQKIVITLDHNPLINLENGYIHYNLIDFLLK